MDWQVVIDWLGQQQELKVIGALILLDVIVAIASSIKTKIFDLQLTADFLLTNVLPYVLVYAVMKGLIFILGGDAWSNAAYIVLAAIVAALLGSIRGHLSELGLNIPLPEFLKPSPEE